MRNWSKWSYSSSIFMFILVCLMIVSCHEIKESFYLNFEEIQKDRIIERGWVPDIIPKSAKSIYERHNIDTNEIWLRFNADREDLKLLEKQIMILNSKEEGTVGIFPQKDPPKWWKPKLENRDFFIIGIYNHEVKLDDGRAKNSKGYFFLDMKDLTAYYWSY